jgi:hypothetical protein
MKLEASFVCDDIRSETGRKISLMGLYDEKLLLVQLPAKISKLCLFQRWSQVRTGTKVEIELRGSAIVTPVRTGPKETRDPLAPSIHAETVNFVKANLLVGFEGINIAAEGSLEFLTFWDGSSSPQHTHIVQVGKLDPDEASKMGLAPQQD